MFVGRQRELAQLETLYAEGQAALFILYGRRRVGKTELLRHFCRDKPGLFFVATMVSDAEQLAEFSRTVWRATHPDVPPGFTFPSWESAFQALADLPDRFAAARRVIVPPGTVVTPSVRDELRRKRIELVVGATAAVAAQRTSSAILMVAATAYDAAPLAAALQRDGVAVESRSSDCVIRATDELAAELASGTTTAILLTAYSAPAMCLANRHAGVRAIHGTGADAVTRDARSVGANLLVVDPTSLGFFAVKQIAGRFLQGGPRECPEVFRKRLGL